MLKPIELVKYKREDDTEGKGKIDECSPGEGRR